MDNKTLRRRSLFVGAAASAVAALVTEPADAQRASAGGAGPQRPNESWQSHLPTITQYNHFGLSGAHNGFTNDLENVAKGYDAQQGNQVNLHLRSSGFGSTEMNTIIGGTGNQYNGFSGQVSGSGFSAFLGNYAGPK